MQKKKRARGRPLLPPSKGKRNQLVFRVTNEMRARLEAAAEVSGRSLSHEMETRLERSFWEEDKTYESFGGRDKHRLMKWLALSIHVAEGITEKSWRKDRKTALFAVAAMSELLQMNVPLRPRDDIHEELANNMGKEIARTLVAGPEAFSKRQAREKREAKS